MMMGLKCFFKDIIDHRFNPQQAITQQDAWNISHN
jgi:hypothetical protein